MNLPAHHRAQTLLRSHRVRAVGVALTWVASPQCQPVGGLGHVPSVLRVLTINGPKYHTSVRGSDHE